MERLSGKARLALGIVPFDGAEVSTGSTRSDFEAFFNLNT